MEKIYISGAITNNPGYKVQFACAAAELAKQGYIVLDPTVLPEGLTWDNYMAIDYAIMRVCDAIYMLKGWEKSKGAKMEHDYAKLLKLKIFYEGEENV